MTDSIQTDERMKELLKQAVVEVLQERKDLLRDLVEEIIEDIALGRAIKEGEGTAPVDRKAVLQILEEGT